MKSSRSIVENRRKKIMHSLEEYGTVKVDTLSSELGVSVLTIRRDLEALESERELERFYGGASLPRKSRDENIFSSTFTFHKHAIARRAAAMVEDGDTIFINTSSTSLLMLRYITAHQVTTITNNGKAIYCDRSGEIMVVLTGGELRSPKESMVGDFALNNLARVSASKCFLGCTGLTPEEGMTTAILQEAAINEMMLRRTIGKRVVLADHSKIGKNLSFVSGSVDMFTAIITDTEAPKLTMDKLRKMQIEVIQVPALKKID